MNSLIKSVKAVTSSGKETFIKNSITTQLSNTVKEIQLYTMNENMTTDSLPMTEAETALCAVIEALLLHGIKDSLVHRARRVIADVDEKPQPSFWAPLLIISHRQIINQITNLSQITTEIGQCRAWVRFALNDSLLSSYLSTMKEESSVLKQFYNTYAFVRDTELLDVAQRLIQGIEAVREFSLPCNSSLLNSWQLQSLILAGIWSPTLRSCPVTAGVDVAQSLQSTSAINSETVSLSSAVSLNSYSSGLGPMLAMNEDEALKIILAKHSVEQNNPTSASSLPPPAADQKIYTSDLSDNEINSADSETIQRDSNFGNSLNKKSGWSFSEIQEKDNDKESTSAVIASPEVDPDTSKSTESSYNALIQSYNMFGGAYIKTPDLREVWQHLDKKDTEKVKMLIEVETPDDIVNINSREKQSETVPLAVHVGKIASEHGLDSQNFQCAYCKLSLPLLPKPNVCSFTAEYICDNCISMEHIQLPARIIHNWDFKMYQVSQKAFNYIKEIENEPTIDLKILNPYIYSVSDEMSRLQALRTQLNFLRDYLYTCREPIIEEFQKQIHGKEYMYEHVHQYSVSDLFQICNGTLVQQLQKVVSFAIEHVQNCWLCNQKGFICEICNKPKVLYPFDIDSVYRCNICNAVYHNSCLNSTKPCPKCERKKKREDLPLLGATMH